MREYKPRAYAGMAWRFLIENPRANLWAAPGLGKTSMVLVLLDILHNVVGEDGPTLVLAPLRVARDTWPQEVTKWLRLAGLTVVAVTGTPEQRRAALRIPAQVYVTNYDQVVWLSQYFTDAKKLWPFKRVVADESPRLKSFRLRQGGVRAQALGRVAHTIVTSWINLTGTPAANGLTDLWGQQWFIDQGKRLGRTFSVFQEQFFIPINHDGYTNWVPRESSQARIMELLADCSLTIDPKDWFDLADPIINIVKVELPAAARKHYKALEKEFFTELNGHAIEVHNAAAKSMKLLQCASGAVYNDDGKTVELHDAKLEALDSIVTEASGAPILVAYHFKSDLARLQRTFPQGRALDTDPRTIADWNAGKVPLLFAHPASAGHGLNLQDGGNIVVFFSQWWDLEQHDQVIERIGPVRQLQSGHQRAVFIHYLIAAQTVDEVVMERRNSKRSVQDMLLEYMKRKT
jgi:SNF2 family DNA or RNA helicase